MKKFKYFAVIASLALFSCEEYMDINSPSPNELSFENASPSKLLPGVQVSAYRTQAFNMNQLGNVFMNSWTRNVFSFGNGFDNELQLNLNTGFYTGIWDNTYRNLKNFTAIINYPNPNHKYDNYIAAAKITRAHYMQTITDLYGDCPFSQAWLAGENLTPAYDDDYEIYKALIADLESARDLISNASSAADDIAPYDVMLAGDMTKWTEFANTLQLRMCLRMSEVTGAKATYRDSKLTSLSGASFITEAVRVNPGYNTSNNDQANPAFNLFAIDAAGNAVQNRTLITMAGHAYKSLQSFATTNYPAAGSQEIIAGSGVFYPNVTDPRSARLFTAGPGNPRRAVTQGSSLVDVGLPTATYPGLPCRIGLGGNFNPYTVHTGTLDGYASIDGFVMTFAESRFLLAEAALRYPALFSGGATFFNDGITDDFLFRGVTTSPATYLSAMNGNGTTTGKPNFGWTGTNQQKLHAIMYQKWVALMGINAIQSYIDYTRTGYPLTPRSLVATKPRLPYRLIYANSEYVANAANVPNVTDQDCFVINQFTPFWVPGAPN